MREIWIIFPDDSLEYNSVLKDGGYLSNDIFWLMIKRIYSAVCRYYYIFVYQKYIYCGLINNQDIDFIFSFFYKSLVSILCNVISIDVQFVQSLIHNGTL